MALIEISETCKSNVAQHSELLRNTTAPSSPPGNELQILALCVIKALIFYHHNLLLPKLMLQGIKSIELINQGDGGDGGAGSIKQINFVAGSHFNYMKHRIDELNHENCVCRYSLIEGDVLGDKVESIVYEVKFETSADGDVCKLTSEYHLVGDFEIKEDKIKAGKEAAMTLYRVIETYLVDNPEVYA